MKNNTRSFLITLSFIVIVLSSSTCKKSVEEISKLPAITQEGKNTFGCLINGKAWVSQGNDNPYPNLRVIVDPADSLIDIRAYSIQNAEKSELFFGSNITKGVGVFQFKIKGKVSLGIFRINGCYITSSDSIYRKGDLKITKYDLQNGILSGEFDCIIYAPSCNDTVRITNGRFDKKL